MSLPIERLEQFAFAKGDEVVLNRYNHAESVTTAISQAFSDEDVLSDYLETLLALVAEKRSLDTDDYKIINERALAKLRNLHG